MYHKDIAKVVVGGSAVECINHIWLASSNLLPLHFLGITLTPAYNNFVIILWVMVCAFSIYYAWIKK
jgi:hypothetical protein